MFCQIKSYNRMLFVLLFLCCSFLCQSKLVQVVMFVRHGARQNVDSLNDYIYQEYDHSHSGELTSVGMRQSQNLGQMLRKEYIEKERFLSSEYKKTEIEVYSTEKSRTIQSAESLTFGMFKNHNEQKLPKVQEKFLQPPFKGKKSKIRNVDSPVPHKFPMAPVKLSSKVVVGRYCPNKLKEEDKTVKNNQGQYDQLYEKALPFIKKCCSVFNKTLEQFSIRNIGLQFDVLLSEKYKGKPLPSGFTEQDYKYMEFLSQWYYYFSLKGNVAKMFNTKKIIKIFNAFDRRIKYPYYSTKWTFIFCHDDDIISLNLALKLGSAKCSSDLFYKGKTDALNCETNGNLFSSNIIIELHEEWGRHYVKVRSSGVYMNLCGKRQKECEYNTFKRQLQGYIASDYERLCGRNTYSERKVMGTQ